MRAFAAAFLLLPLAACGISRPAPESSFFLIQPEWAGAPAAGPIADALRIGRVEVAPPFDGRAMVYRRDDVRYETDYYNRFAANPADMLAAATADWLRRSGLFRQVRAPGGGAQMGYRLEASVSALYVDFRSTPPAAVLALHWQVQPENGGQGGLDLDCRQRVALAERSPAGSARAFRQAVGQALAELEAALAATLFNSGPPTGRGGIPG